VEPDGAGVSGPLAGIRVVDCSRRREGWPTTWLLADSGAEVVWVEPPGGDPSRAELAAQHAVFNRGKRSVILDLASDPGDRLVLAELVARADVLVFNWALPGPERLAVRAAAEDRGRPGLVTCAVSAWAAEDGPELFPGYEALVHARVGSMAEQKGHRAGPIYPAVPFASIGAALLATIGILAALHCRRRDGKGRHVQTSLLDGALAYLSMYWGGSDARDEPDVVGNFRNIGRTFRCADDEYLGIHTGAVGAFNRLLKLLGLTELVPASADGRDLGKPLDPAHKRFLDERLPDLFAARSREEWLDVLRNADICAVPALRAGQIFDEPQVRHNRAGLIVDDPALGPIEQVAPPLRWTGAAAVVPAPAPSPGQHTSEVLAELRDGSPPAPDAARSASGAEPDGPPLAGLHVLDAGQFYAGPYSSRLLADLGAEVIKLEPPGGDPLRGRDVVFESAQAGKRSIVLDLKDPAARPILHRLLRWADVVHHNMRPGAAERLGLGDAQVRAVNPGIVYLHAPGWGSDGPDRVRQSFAPLLSNYVGASFEVGGELNPPFYPISNEDSANGLLGAAATLMALLDHRRDPSGAHIENPQLHAAMVHMAHVVRRPAGEAIGSRRTDPLQLGLHVFDRLWPTLDGWICVVAETPEERWALGRVTGVDTGSGDRAVADRDDPEAYALERALGDAFATRTSSDWAMVLDAAGVPAAIPAIDNRRAFLTDPEHRRTRRVAEAVHPRRGNVRAVARLLRMSGCEWPPYRLAPELGEHTEEIILELGRVDVGGVDEAPAAVGPAQ